MIRQIKKGNTKGLPVGPRLRREASRHGQSLIEYAIVVALVSAAMVAMSTYVFRSVQATQKTIEEGFQSN